MRVYTEDEITFPHGETRKLHDIPGWESFQKDSVHIVPNNYLFDARKFAHKVYAQLDAFESGERYVVWLDGDIVFKKELTRTFLRNLVKGCLAAYLGRRGAYTETGFLIFDTKHPDFDIFKRRYRDFYDKRLIFMLDYWIDCMAFDAAIHDLEARNLTPEVSGLVDVFSRSPLAEIMDHDKGARKYKRQDEVLSKAAV